VTTEVIANNIIPTFMAALALHPRFFIRPFLSHSDKAVFASIDYVALCQAWVGVPSAAVIAVLCSVRNITPALAVSVSASVLVWLVIVIYILGKKEVGYRRMRGIVRLLLKTVVVCIVAAKILLDFKVITLQSGTPPIQ
jgi:hypothetical protein